TLPFDRPSLHLAICIRGIYLKLRAGILEVDSNDGASDRHSSHQRAILPQGGICRRYSHCRLAFAFHAKPRCPENDIKREIPWDVFEMYCKHALDRRVYVDFNATGLSNRSQDISDVTFSVERHEVASVLVRAAGKRRFPD